MKHLKDLARDTLPEKNRNLIVDQIAVVGGWRRLENPTFADDLKCLTCGEMNYYTPYADPTVSKSRVWICANGNCGSNDVKSWSGGGIPQTPHAIGWLWPQFCEIHGIGDVHHDVKFEDVQQNKEKIAYMLQFLKKPKGIIYMQGGAGSGKTYSAMAMCQYFTMSDRSCFFSTQTQLLDKWLEIKNNEIISNFLENIRTVKLLVIDDFGTGEISPGFMKFFFDLINTRMQWSDRGTVLTTNLDNDKLAEFCGEALIDRIRTGQLFKYTNKASRRPKAL